MEHTLKREELYEKVWAEPLRVLAPQLGVSDVAIAKACRKADIPLPGRGHWAKLRAGKPTDKFPLPPRFPGASDTITFGKDNYGGNTSWRSDLLNNPLPTPPTFEETEEQLRERVKNLVGKVKYPRLSDQTHPIIKVFLDEDEKRIVEYEKKQRSWYKPYFDTPIEKRRLRILNALFLAMQRLGCRPHMETSSYYMEKNRKSSITVGIQSVNFTLTTVAAKKSSKNELNKTKDIFRLSILKGTSESDIRCSWEDTTGEKLEKKIQAIVNEIIVIGELEFREATQSHHNWLVKLKAELEEEERQEILRKERKAQEQKEREEKARIDKLLSEAIALQQAETIRQYVAKIKNQSESIKASTDDINRWAQWALEQANRIDPSKNISLLSGTHVATKE